MEAGKLKIELVTSEDGSHTLRIPELKEHYHSHKGALRECEHVFIQMGLESLSLKAEISLLEVGFGTGLNALVTFFRRAERVINYTAIEPVPLKLEIIEQLNYASLLQEKTAADVFQKLHRASWNEWVEITSGFHLEKREEKLEDFQPIREYDLIYYDAFAPHAQSELWEVSIWRQLYGIMKSGGVLVTYCAKGQVRRDMQEAGFMVERLPGPPGKREMLRATK